jgi:hypothetical protein
MPTVEGTVVPVDVEGRIVGGRRDRERRERGGPRWDRNPATRLLRRADQAVDATRSEP